MWYLVLQLHKKGSSSTTVQSYKPTAEEVRMQKQAADYAEAVAPNALRLNDTAAKLLWDSLGSTQVDFSGLNKTAQNQISQSQTGVQNLINGQLPSAYTANMQNQIQQGVQNSMGNMLNTLGANGVLNSSVTNKGIADINDAASQAMANAYTQNIGLLSQLYGQQQTGATAGITAGAAAQEAAQQPAINLWNASTGLNQGGTGTALAGISGRGTSSTTVSNSGGSGLFGGLLGGLATGWASNSSGIFCFAGDTKVKTPNGEKKISSIKPGDKVLCARFDGPDRVDVVKDVLRNAEDTVYMLVAADAYGEDFKVKTTATQPFYRENGFTAPLKELHIGDTIRGENTLLRIRGIAPLGTEKVYDLKLTDENKYYANGFVALAGTNEW